ncbi:hypothetical protein QLX08_007008 [Tetragonisca angustula]|uniref:Uncharacterized protein n=1 Tax=Tetragonisca angustula TaxID=166442 RepID=A0AAW0ZST2_9HYME
MKSIVLNVLFILIVACLVLQAQSEGCTCGGLGPGSNPCSCSEVVVKAQKLPKPTYYVSPEEIKDVVIAKNIQVDCSNSQSEKNSSSSNGSNSNSCGCKNNQKTGSTSIVESESISVYTDVSTDSISSGSEVKVKSCSNNPSKSKPDCSCKKEKIETLEIDDSISFDGNVAPRFSPIGDLCYPLPPVVPNHGKIIEKTKVTPAYPGKFVCCPPSVPYEICINTATGKIKTVPLDPSDTTSSTSKTSYGDMNFGTLGGSNSVIYNLPLIYTRNRQQQYPKMSMGSSSSDCFNDATGETQEHNSAPAMPADAVSLTLAYKNLRAPNVIYRQGKQFVPEDKLSFGHRTIPTDVKTENQMIDIAEEKLVTVNKPVVELKIAPQKTIVIGSYDEQEEARLAELEAIEHESITKEEVSDQMSESLISYKDLGYAPVDVTNINAKSIRYNEEISNKKIEEVSAEEPCGPLGPSVPGYIPGKIIVQERITDSFRNPKSRLYI